MSLRSGAMLIRYSTTTKIPAMARLPRLFTSEGAFSHSQCRIPSNHVRNAHNIESDTVVNERPVAPTQVVVHDVSGEEDEYTLDVYGFQLLKHESTEKTFDDEKRIREYYYKECEEIYKNV
jgi:hypothetical protein